MRLSPPAQLAVRARRPPARSELLLRYAASYGCTLIAIAAANLIIPTWLALALAAVTLIGLPISLYWRASKMHIFGVRVPRFLINSVMMTLTVVACVYMLLSMQPELFTRGLYYTIMLSPSAGNSITTLMNLFLIFAAVRSLAIINDKDAVLSAVPSFSVLLLLIVIDRGPAVVAYFLLWALVSAVLFALDHRQESRYAISGIIPSLEPGQDIRLSARGLATTMGFSLLCAMAISYYASSRDPEERGTLEAWVLGLAGRITQLALNIPDVSVNSGPERQIDFSSGPALPTRAELWSVAAANFQGKPIRPEYWRMFTLSKYNGATWSQNSGQGTYIPFQQLSEQQWPIPQVLRQPNSRQPATRTLTPPLSTSRAASAGKRSTPGGRAQVGRTRTTPQSSETSEDEEARRLARRRRGYSIATRHPFGQRILRSFGGDRQWVIQVVEPLTTTVGFAPLLPAARTLRIRSDKPPSTIRVRQDGGVDVGVLQPGQPLVVISEVSPGESYGVGRNPDSLMSARSAAQIANSGVYLSPAERRNNLQLPARLLAANSRVKQLAQQVLTKAPADESNYQSARRLAVMLQTRATYTLRPPAIPARADAAEYFLFESRRGYCTYFAGALTVLCRSAGIPARVVSGFVNPDWNTNTQDGQRGILREANAHAWTEVWVEGWGWTSIDGTPPDDRGDNAPSWTENWADFFATIWHNSQRRLRQHLNLAAGVLAILSTLGLSVLWRRGFADPFLARLQQASKGRVKLTGDQSRRLIFKAYERASKKLARRFRRRVDWETPSEWLAAAETTLNLENPQPLRELTRLFLQAEYSPRAISDAEGVAAYEALKNLSFKTRQH